MFVVRALRQINQRQDIEDDRFGGRPKGAISNENNKKIQIDNHKIKFNRADTLKLLKEHIEHMVDEHLDM